MCRLLAKYQTIPLPFLILLVFLSACSGTLSGGDWQTGGLQHERIYVLTVNSNNPQVVYAANMRGQVFVSSDAGQHWNDHSLGLPLPTTIHKLSFDISSKKLYAATDNGLFVSSDTSQRWLSIVGSANAALPIDSYTALDIDYQNSNNLFVGTSHHSVLVSTNGGKSWKTANTGLPQNATIYDLQFDTNQHQLWAATSAGVYRSDDIGSTWSVFNAGLPANTIAYALCPADINGGMQGLIYLGTNKGFFLSHDLGNRWAAGLADTSVRQVIVDFRSTNSATVFVATDLGAFRSDDSGQSWNGIAAGLPRKQPVYDLVLGANNYAQLYAATTNGVYLFPGNGGAPDITRIISIVVLLFFFFLLYLITRKLRKPRTYS